MNSTATWSSAATEHGGDVLQLSKKAITVSTFLVMLTIALSLWVCWKSQRSLHRQAALAETIEEGGVSLGARNLISAFDSSIWLMTGAAGLTGAVSLGLVMFVQNLWRRRFTQCLKRQALEFESKAGLLESQTAEARRARESAQLSLVEMEEKLKVLKKGHSELQEELDRRTRAEKALTQKRQELESSKNVLEIHVQARTQELQKLQRLYEMILNSAGEGICGMDIEGKTTFVNPAVAKMSGRKLDELIGKPAGRICNIQGPDGQTPEADSIFREGTFVRADGTSFPVEFVRTPINEKGQPVGSVFVFKDITQRKQAEESLSQKAAELARSNAELEQFAFVASHDLQEPLRKIQAFGDRLKGKCAGILPPEAQDYLDRMDSAAARMRTLINDLLTFSRVIRSMEPCIAVDLGQVVRDVLNDLEVRIEKSGASVEIGSMVKLEADPMQMRQLFQNLVGNALKFQPPGNKPVVKISCRVMAAASGTELCEISVSDNGIGFEEKYAERIFAVFQRLHGRTEYEGTGVGLAVCRRIVDRHGGSIVARSTPGEGATFLITLPMKQAQARTSA
jgi:PAS domain S-box-containing protein